MKNQILREHKNYVHKFNISILGPITNQKRLYSDHNACQERPFTNVITKSNYDLNFFHHAIGISTWYQMCVPNYMINMTKQMRASQYPECQQTETSLYLITLELKRNEYIHKMKMEEIS